MTVHRLVVLALLAQYPIALAALYHLTDNWQGSSFWDNFLFEAIDDPTHGRVKYVAYRSNFLCPLFLIRPCRGVRYVDRDTAELLGLATTNDWPPHIILGADSTTKLRPTGPGRRSVRVRSHKQFSHNTLLIADILHMPQGCG